MANRKFNRTNQTPMEYIFVGAGNQALAAGALTNGTTALGILNQQLGVLSTDNQGTVLANNFITAGTTSQQVKRVKVLQGTPVSQDLLSASPFGIGAKKYLATPEIDPANLVEVSTTLPEVAAMSAISMGAFAVPTTATDYSLTATFGGTTLDIEYAPQRRLSLNVTVTTPITAPAFPTSWVLQSLASKANRGSVYNPTTGSGKQYLVLGLGAAGTLISGIQAGTVIPIQTISGQIVNFTATIPFVKMLQNTVANGVITGAEFIVNIDAVAAGTTNAINQLLVMGLVEPTALLYDEETRNIIHVESAGCTLDNTTVRASAGKDWVGSGKGWFFQWKKRFGKIQGAFENWYPSALDGSVETSPSYIVNGDSTFYTSTLITWNTVEGHTSEFTQTIPHRLTILLPASITNPTATVAVPYVVATTDAATVTALNASLGAWINHAYQQWSNHKYYQAATPAAPFV